MENQFPFKHILGKHYAMEKGIAMHKTLEEKMKQSREQIREELSSHKVEELTKVVFRKYKEGDIIALFPTIPGDYNPATCSSFIHVGQHGAADYNHVIDSTVPASPREYAALWKELESQPYNYRLMPYERSSRSDFLDRSEQISKMR